MDVSMMELSKRRTLKGKNREEGNGKPPRLFSLDMIPIDGCFEDVLQLWPLFFDVNCRLTPVIDGCFKDVLQQNTRRREEEEDHKLNNETEIKTHCCNV